MAKITTVKTHESGIALGGIGAGSVELLPDGAMLLAYEQAMRFLTDYLNGDTYYKTLFPGHNLVRARTQIRLFTQIPE